MSSPEPPTTGGCNCDVVVALPVDESVLLDSLDVVDDDDDAPVEEESLLLPPVLVADPTSSKFSIKLGVDDDDDCRPVVLLAAALV